VSRWVSVDPILGSYLNGKPNGGVYNAINLNLYIYCLNNPINYFDPDGKWAVVDDVIFAVGGAIVGLAGQVASDVIYREVSDWEDYVGSSFGGAVGGWTLLYTGPVVAGAAGGASCNAARQVLKRFVTKKQKELSVTSFVVETSISAVGGKIPGFKIKGINVGRGSYNSIYKRLAKKTTNKIAKKTAAKMFVGRAVDKGLFRGAIFSSSGSRYIGNKLKHINFRSPKRRKIPIRFNSATYSVFPQYRQNNKNK